jgi:hypothetical protein
MQLSISTQPLQLVTRQFLSFRRGRGTRIHCNSGLMWITVGDNRDILLAAGESFTVDRDDVVMLNTMLASQIILQPPRTAPASQPHLPRIRARLLQGPRRLLAALLFPPIAPWRREIRY